MNTRTWICLCCQLFYQNWRFVWVRLIKKRLVWCWTDSADLNWLNFRQIAFNIEALVSSWCNWGHAIIIDWMANLNLSLFWFNAVLHDRKLVWVCCSFHVQLHWLRKLIAEIDVPQNFVVLLSLCSSSVSNIVNRLKHRRSFTQSQHGKRRCTSCVFSGDWLGSKIIELQSNKGWFLI